MATHPLFSKGVPIPRENGVRFRRTPNAITTPILRSQDTTEMKYSKLLKFVMFMGYGHLFIDIYSDFHLFIDIHSDCHLFIDIHSDCHLFIVIAIYS